MCAPLAMYIGRPSSVIVWGYNNMDNNWSEPHKADPTVYIKTSKQIEYGPFMSFFHKRNLNYIHSVPLDCVEWQLAAFVR